MAREYHDAMYLHDDGRGLNYTPCLIMGIFPGCVFTNYKILFFDDYTENYVERMVAAPALFNKVRED